jgi:hypothetical protein
VTDGTGRWRGRLPWLAAWLATVPFALIRAGVLAEADSFWQARTGQLILATGRIPHADPFSWTAAGTPWRPNSWAFDVLLALAYRAGGLPGMALLGAAFILVIAAVQLWCARRWGASPAVGALAVCAGLPIMAGWLTVRPQLVDYAVVPVLLLLLAMVSDGSRWVAAAAGVGLLQAVWVNLHASALLGPAVIVAWAVADLLSRKRGAGRWRWVVVLLVAVAATMANPFGIGIVAQAVHVRSESVDIVEWAGLRPTDLIEVLLLLIACAAVVVGWRRRWHPLVAVAGMLAAAGIAAIRLMPVAALVALPMLAAGAAQSARLGPFLAGRRALLRTGTVGLCVAFLVMALGNPGIGRPNAPARAVAALPSGCRLFNGEIVGGLIILRRPDVPVSLDTRNDVYGAAALRAHYEVENAATNGARAMAELGVTCVLIPSESPLAAQLRTDPGWREVIREADGTLFLAQVPTPGRLG